MNIQQLNENTLLLKPDFHIISGRKKLRVEDLNLPVGTSLPPEQVASLGSKKFINPEEIAKFNRLRDQAHKACEKIGVKFLGGYAVPMEKTDELLDELDRIVSDFGDVRDVFLKNYEKIINDWCQQNHEWEQILRKAIPPVSHVAASLSADYYIFQAGVPEGVSSERLDRQASGLADQMFHEIAKDADKFIKESLSVKFGNGGSKLREDDVGVTQKALRPIRRLRDKMEGLAFLDSSIRSVIDHIDQVLAKMPAEGRIKDNDFKELLTLAIAMSDSEKIRLLGTAFGTGEPNDVEFADPEIPKIDDMVLPVLEESGTPMLEFDTPAEDPGRMRATDQVFEEVAEIDSAEPDYHDFDSDFDDVGDSVVQVSEVGFPDIPAIEVEENFF